jgi:sugar lactone lactonase YvrE
LLPLWSVFSGICGSVWAAHIGAHGTMQSFIPRRRLAWSVFAAAALLCYSHGAVASDTYNGTTLSIPTLVIGNATFTNVVVTVGQILSGPTAGPVNSSPDSYDPSTGYLTVRTVVFRGNTYYNVLVTVGSLLSIGSVSGADSYAGTQLMTPAVQIGPLVYHNIVLALSTADVVRVAGGMPSAAIDQYTTAGHLLIPAVQVGNKVYTNVTVNANPSDLVVGAGFMRLLAGGLGGYGSVDGYGSSARFYYPSDVAIDSAGNLFVADDYNRTIRKISAGGVVSTLAGTPQQSGTADGVGAAARFNGPGSIAVDPEGNVYVVDAGVNTIRKVTPSGTVTTLAGTPLVYGTADGTGPAAQFSNPGSIRWNTAGSLYLTDNDRVRNITTNGVVTTVYVGFLPLSGIAIGTSALLLTDPLNKRVYSLNLGTGALTTLASGYENPGGIALAPPSSALAGTVYVSDGFGCTIDTIGAGGAQGTLAGLLGQCAYDDGTGSNARFYLPANIIADSTGNLIVADEGNNSIRRVTPAGLVTTIAGVGAQAGYVDATGSAARFNNPEALSTDTSGNIYVADSNAIRKVTQGGVVTTAYPVAGTSGLALDAAGNAYVSTYTNTILKIAPDGTSAVFAGSQTAGYGDGPGTVARFNHPNGIVFDAAGNLIVADTGNFLIRKISPAGWVTTICGTAGTSGSADGTATTATFTAPFTLAIDSGQNIVVADGNAIRRVDAGGNVSTIAGSQTAGYADGAGAAAQFNGPAGLTAGASGSIFVADSQNHTIRKISSNGTVSTVAGVAGKAGVTLGTLPATLNVPVGIAYVGSTLYVVDAQENSVLSLVGQF